MRFAKTCTMDRKRVPTGKERQPHPHVSHRVSAGEFRAGQAKHDHVSVARPSAVGTSAPHSLDKAPNTEDMRCKARVRGKCASRTNNHDRRVGHLGFVVWSPTVGSRGTVGSVSAVSRERRRRVKRWGQIQDETDEQEMGHA